MAQFIRIASLPAAPLRVPDTHDYEAVVQQEIAHWRRQLEPVLCDRPDLIVTPECCDRPADIGGENRLEYYRSRGDRIRDFFADVARTHRCNIAYSAVRELPDHSFRNSMQMINRQGGVDGVYDKYLPVIEEYTEYGIRYGAGCAAIETDIGRVCGAICFDLNFEEPLRLTAREQPALTLFPSMYHGGYMQRHWAYQTRSYFVSCVAGIGASIVNPVGEVVAENSNYYPYLSATVNLDYRVVHLDHNWARLDAMKKKYGPRVEAATPFGLGCVLLTCQDESLTMGDIVREFGMELWDDYYARSVAARELPGRIGR